MKEIFLNMDRALKYIHEHGYCIRNFDPSCIEILNDSLNQIRFSELMQMPDDPMQQKQIVKEDIYKLTINDTSKNILMNIEKLIIKVYLMHILKIFVKQDMLDY